MFHPKTYGRYARPLGNVDQIIISQTYGFDMDGFQSALFVENADYSSDFSFFFFFFKTNEVTDFISFISWLPLKLTATLLLLALGIEVN